MPRSVFHPPTGSLWRSLRRRRVPEPREPVLTARGSAAEELANLFASGGGPLPGEPRSGEPGCASAASDAQRERADPGGHARIGDPPLAVLPMGTRAGDRVTPMHLALWAPRRTEKAWEVVVSAPPLLDPTALRGDSSLRALVEGGHLLRLLLHFAYDYPEGADLAGTPGVAPPGPSSEPIAWSGREHVEGSRIVVFGPRRVHEPRLSTWCPLTIEGVERRAYAEDALFAVVHACAAVDRLVTFRW